MILVQVQVTVGVHKLAGLVAADLCHHHEQQRIAGNVEGHAEEQIAAALVELQAQAMLLALLLRGNHAELEQAVARGQRHAVHFGHIPCAYQMPAAPGIILQSVNQLGNLVNAAALAIRPGAPLAAVHGPQVAILIGPLIPDAHASLLQPAHIGTAFQKPEKLVNDRAQMQFLGREAREALAQITANLPTEHADSARAGPVFPAHPVGEHIIKQCQILMHSRIGLTIDD